SIIASSTKFLSCVYMLFLLSWSEHLTLGTGSLLALARGRLHRQARAVDRRTAGKTLAVISCSVTDRRFTDTLQLVLADEPVESFYFYREQIVWIWAERQCGRGILIRTNHL